MRGVTDDVAGCRERWTWAVRLVKSFLAILVAAGTLACGEQDAALEQGDVLFAPLPLGTATVPYSENGTVAVLPGGSLACVVESYEFRIHCVDPTGRVVGTFGSEGSGPGELGWDLVSLIGGRGGMVGVIDNELKRFSVFTPLGSLVTAIPLPGAAIALNALGAFGDTLSGIGLTGADPTRLAGGLGVGGLYTVFDIEVATGRILHQQALPPVSVGVDCGSIHWGFPNRLGGWLYIACEGHLVLLAENGETKVIQSPTYTGELPTDADIALRIEEMKFLENLGLPPFSDERLERYRSTPKNYHMELGAERFDAFGHVLIATERDRQEFSYLDVFSAGELEYLGSIRIRDRLIGFDLVESTLVTLVERRYTQSGEEALVPTRHLDWYDLADFGDLAGARR